MYASSVIAALFLAGVVLAAGFFYAPAAASHQPADKVSVAGSALEIMSAPLVDGSASEEHTLLSTSLKTSTPTDLILSLTAECALWTDVTTVGNDDSEAIATVTVWIELDDVPVVVSSDDTGGGAGEVVFCNRAYHRVTSLFDDENATIETFIRTRSANAFNWMTLNVGNGEHEITVKSRLDSQVTGTGMAKAAVGKRTLVVEPVKLDAHATL